MSTREATAIAIKFLGLYLVINIAIYMPSLALQVTATENYTGEQVDRSTVALFMAAYFGIGLSICYVLFRLANSVLKSSSVDDSTDESRMSQNFLLQIVGVFFVVSAVSELPRFIPAVSGIGEVGSQELWYLPGAGLELAIGLWFVAGSSLWEKWLRRVRS